MMGWGREREGNMKMERHNRILGVNWWLRKGGQNLCISLYCYLLLLCFYCPLCFSLLKRSLKVKAYTYFMNKNIFVIFGLGRTRIHTLQESISTKQSSSVEVTRRSSNGAASKFKNWSLGSSHLHIQE